MKALHDSGNLGAQVCTTSRLDGSGDDGCPDQSALPHLTQILGSKQQGSRGLGRSGLGIISKLARDMVMSPSTTSRSANMRSSEFAPGTVNKRL